MVTFHPFQKVNLDLILSWFEKHYVKEWFHGQGVKNMIRNLELYAQGVRTNGNYFFDFWVAHFEKKPFGLLMTTPLDGPYDPDDPYEKWFEEGKEIITLDCLIGEESHLGKGLGQRMIRELLQEKFPQAHKVLIDPDIKNTRAIHVYERVGFNKVEEFIPHFDTTFHVMMHLDLARKPN